MYTSNPLTFRPQFDGSQCQSEVFFVWHEVQNFIGHSTACNQTKDKKQKHEPRAHSLRLAAENMTRYWLMLPYKDNISFSTVVCWISLNGWCVPLRLRIQRMSKFLRMESPLRSRLSGMDCKASLANSRSICAETEEWKTNKLWCPGLNTWDTLVRQIR